MIGALKKPLNNSYLLLPLLCGLLMVVYNANLRSLSSGDCVPAKLLPFSLLVEKNLDLDEFVHFFPKEEGFELAPYVHRTHGHWMSAYPVVIPILISPLYLPVSLWLQSQGIPYASSQWFYFAEWMEMLSASLITTLSAVFVYLTLGQLCQCRAALALTLVYALATNTWTISSRALWQHEMSELMLSVTCYALLKARTDVRFLLLAGLGIALAVANRPPNFLFALLFVHYTVQVHRWQTWRFLAFPLIIGALLLTYNFYYFGTLTGPVGPHQEGVFGTGKWTNPLWGGVAGLLISPSRGLFIYTPVTLLSFWGIYKVWREKEWPALFMRYLSLGIVAQIVLFAKWSTWPGGSCYGPRYLTDILPLLVLLLVPILSQLGRAKGLWSIFVAAALYSLGVQVVGAFYYLSTPEAYWEGSPLPSPLDPHPERFWLKRLWDWSDTQILRSVRYGKPSFPFYAQAKYLLASPPWVFGAEELPHRVGTVVRDLNASRGKALAAGERGWLVYGPYQPLSAGKYRATFFLKMPGQGATGEVATLDVAAELGTVVLARRTLTDKDFSADNRFQKVNLPFEVVRADGYKSFEYRVFSTGRRPLIVDRVVLEREGTP